MSVGYNLQKISYLIKTYYKSNRIGKEEDGSFLTRKWSITDSNDVQKINSFLLFAFPRLIDWCHFFSSTCADAEEHPVSLGVCSHFGATMQWRSIQGQQAPASSCAPQSAFSAHPEPCTRLNTLIFAFSPCLVSFYIWQEQIPAQLSITHILPSIPHCYSHKAFQNLN